MKERRYASPEEKQGAPMIPCACHCGEMFPKFDKLGRERRYINGHFMRGVIRRAIADTARGLEPFR